MPEKFNFIFSLLPDDIQLSGLELGNAHEAVSPVHIEAQLTVAKHFGYEMANTPRQNSVWGWGAVYPRCLKTAPDPYPTEECIDEFIHKWGSRMFKRPMDPTEVEKYRLIFLTFPIAKEGVQRLWTLWALSPHFLYNLYNQSTPVSDDSNVYKLTPVERATQLAYALTGAGPDDSLVEKAQSGELNDPNVYRSEFDRLFEDNREHLDDFTDQWLKLDKFLEDHHYQRYDNVGTEYRNKSGIQYFSDHRKTPPNTNNNALQVISDHIIKNHNFSTYFNVPLNLVPLSTTSSNYMRFSQAVTGNSKDDPFIPDIPERRGILTHLSTNMHHQNDKHVNPIFKGIYIRENLLCQDAGNFPLDINTAPSNTALPDRDDSNKHLSTRTIVHNLTKSPECWSCHKMWNPIGNVMSNYGALGDYRLVENIFRVDGDDVTFLNDIPLDVKDTIYLDGQEHLVDGITEFQTLLSGSKTAQTCYTNKLLFNHMLGRSPNSSDLCFLEESRRDLTDSSLTIKDMIYRALTSDKAKFKTVRK